MASNSPSHGDLRAAKRVEEEAIKGLGALISNPSRMLPLLSIGQNKPQDYPRFKGRGSRIYLLMEEVQRYVFLANNLPQTADPLKNMVAIGQTFDTADSASHMSHLVVHSLLSAWEIHKWVRSPLIGVGGNTRQFRLRLYEICVENKGWAIILS